MELLCRAVSSVIDIRRRRRLISLELLLTINFLRCFCELFYGVVNHELIDMLRTDYDEFIDFKLIMGEVDGNFKF